MIINNKRKTRALLCLILMQFSAYGITSTQAKLYAALFGVAGAAIGNKSDDPKVMIGAGIGLAGLAYYCLKKYTSGPILAQVRTTLSPVSKDRFAFEYKETFASKEKEELIGHINRSYQNNLQEENYPLIIARNELIDFKMLLSQADYLLKYTKFDAYKDEAHKKLWLELDAEKDKYFENINDALARIIATEPEYTDILQKYTEFKATNTQLRIAAKNAESKAEIAKATQVAAQAETTKAKAIENFTLLEWLKFFFGSKTK